MMFENKKSILYLLSIMLIIILICFFSYTYKTKTETEVSFSLTGVAYDRIERKVIGYKDMSFKGIQVRKLLSGVTVRYNGEISVDDIHRQVDISVDVPVEEGFRIYFSWQENAEILYSDNCIGEINEDFSVALIYFNIRPDENKSYFDVRASEVVWVFSDSVEDSLEIAEEL